MLARDVAFFRDNPIDMIGMGPWLPTRTCPCAAQPLARTGLTELALNIIAVARLACPDVNIAATTALQAMVPDGPERGLGYGADVTMPQPDPGGGPGHVPALTTASGAWTRPGSNARAAFWAGWSPSAGKWPSTPGAIPPVT